VFAFFVTIHVLICVALILVVLLQAGRGGGLAGAFGAGAAQTFFGGRGAATFLAKTTSWLAVAFMGMSILLAVLSSRGESARGLMQERAKQRSGQPQLPPSTSAFDPGTADTSAAPMFPPVAPGEAPPNTPAPNAPPAPAPNAPAPTPTPSGSNP
jgi:preprotein translocase subunit SecG